MQSLASKPVVVRMSSLASSLISAVKTAILFVLAARVKISVHFWISQQIVRLTDLHFTVHYI